MDYSKYLMEHLSRIDKTQKQLVVFMGFDKSFYEQVTFPKLLSLQLSSNIQDLDTSKPQSLSEAITKIALTDHYLFWCTYEELLLLGEDILKMYFKIIILKNNIYHQTYPSLYEIGSLNTIYPFINGDAPENDDNGNIDVGIVQKYYGSVKKVGEKIYVTYASHAEQTEEISFFSYTSILPTSSQSAYDPTVMELSEREEPFLQFTENLLLQELQPGTIPIAFSGALESFPNEYVNRLEVLQHLNADIYKLQLVSKTIDPKPDLDETEYLRILKTHWKHTSFRKLKIYKNIHEVAYNKETIDVSQSQVIDDIVKQAEQSLRGESYKDIFVTSPTGAGKSVMFQIPAIYLAEKHNTITIVISPLIGLMTDQVEGLHNRNVAMSATINSEISPIEKMEISEKIENGDINLLYISPETLLSRSDISQLIGDRRIGLFVIDEAHIVTTWGKAFRSDYWYLGSYLDKLRKEKQFPIATFTATAIYGGVEDMYAETRDSLGLNNPITYFGYIKRDQS